MGNQAQDLIVIILIRREIGDACRFAGKRVPAIDIRTPLQAEVYVPFYGVWPFIWHGWGRTIKREPFF
jgi:hypothetical protein